MYGLSRHSGSPQTYRICQHRLLVPYGGVMKPKLAILLAFIGGLLMMSVPLTAHHGTGVAYETDKEVTLKGTVVEWIWANPHCGVLFDVTDDKGNVVHWGGEMGNPHQMSGAA